MLHLQTPSSMESSKYPKVLPLFIRFHSRPLFGLFSQPVSTAIGDNNKYKTNRPARDEDGKPVTEKRNFYTTGSKRGHTDSVYFSKPSYICTGDPFKMAAMESMRTNVKDGYLKGGHDRNFIPAKVVQEKMKKLPYNYMPLMENVKDPAKYRDEEGGVITENRNFYTNPVKRGNVGKGTSFGGMIPYKEDLYDIQKELAKKEREYHDTKIQDKPFSQRAK